MDAYYYTLIAFSILMLIIVSVLLVRNDTLTNRTKKTFLYTTLLIATASCCECLGVFWDGYDVSFRIPHIIVKFMELSIAPFIPVLAGNGIYAMRSKRIPMLFLGIHTCIEFLSMKYGIVFYVDEFNVYHHSTFYTIYYIAYVLGCVFLLVHIIRFCRHYQNQNKLSLLLILSFIGSGVICQAFNGSLKVVWLAVAVGFVLFYIYYADLLQQVDPLTQLLNRRNYENRIRGLRGKAIVLFADINDFKEVNDRYGHLKGDDCLTMVGKALKGAYGKHGICYRIGGDEFGVILNKRNYDGQLEQLNADFVQRMNQMRREEPYLPSLAVGYAEFDSETMDISDAVANADRMMYQVKQECKKRKKS